MKRISLLFVVIISSILLLSPPLINSAREDSSIGFLEDLDISTSFVPPSNLTLEIGTPNAEQQIASNGCCAGHGGVRGCVGGGVLCNDGTFSSYCACYRDTNLNR